MGSMPLLMLQFYHLPSRCMPPLNQRTSKPRQNPLFFGPTSKALSAAPHTAAANRSKPHSDTALNPALAMAGRCSACVERRTMSSTNWSELRGSNKNPFCQWRTKSRAQPHTCDTKTGSSDAIASLTVRPHGSILLTCTNAAANP